MQTFKDNAGRAWCVTISVDAIKRVRAHLKIDLMALDQGLFEKLISDPILLCDLVYVLCKPEADAQKITDEDFGRSMGGDAIDGATEAVLKELVGFFPSGRRELIQHAVEKLRRLETLALDRAHKKLDSKEMEQAMERELSRLEASGGPSMNSPVSAA